MADVRTQLKNAIDTLAETAKNATDWVADKSDATRESATDDLGSVRDRMTSTARGLADSTVRAKSKVGEWVDDVTTPATNAVASTKDAVNRANHELTDTIKKHPLTAIAVCFGIGMLIGKHIRRD